MTETESEASGSEASGGVFWLVFLEQTPNNSSFFFFLNIYFGLTK